MSKFAKFRICDLGETVTGKTPSSNNPEDFGGAYLFVTPTDSFDAKYISKTERYLSETGMRRLKSKVLPPKSLMVTCIGSAMGKVALNKFSALTNQQINSIRVNSAKFDPDYLYYALRNNYKVLRNASTGSTALPLLNKTDFDALGIVVHNHLPTQQKIAAVLSALDAKIELNNRINTELEASAKMQYDFWFVQFDFPAKTDKPYKSSGGKMVWNKELKREIPDGWKVKKLGTVLDTSLGGTPSTHNKSFWENGTFNWLNSGEIADFPIVSSELKITKDAIKKSATDLLPKGTTLLSITRHLRPTILAIDACANQSVVGIKEKGNIKSCYIYPYLKNEIPRLLVLRTGAQQPHINKETVDSSLMVLPSDNSKVLDEYNKIAGPLYNQIINNAFQNQHLSSLRDWLLPMLMNGQVKVS